MIQLLATIPSAGADARGDLVGPIGGDDYIVVFQSVDWRVRIESALAEFDNARLQRRAALRRTSEIAIRPPRSSMPHPGRVGTSPEFWYLTSAAAMVASIHAA